MGLRFHRSFRLPPGLRLNLSRAGVGASTGGSGAWPTVRPRGTRATVGLPGTGLSYSEQSPWARPNPHAVPAPGIEVAELPRDEIEIRPATAHEARAPAASARANRADDDEILADPRLVPIVVVIVALVAAAAVLWAMLV